MSAPRPADKIEITEEMIAAGARVIDDIRIDLTDGFVSPADVAEAVFLAMLAVQEGGGEDR
jgi:hypothetical protein